MNIYIDVTKQNDLKKRTIGKMEIKKIVNACLKESHRKNKGCYIKFLFVDRSTMRYVNKITKKQDHATNVLAFLPKKNRINNLIEDGYIKAPVAKHYRGTIIACHDIIKEEANKLKITIKERYYTMLVHGILHLLGFDHANKKQKDIMLDIEKEILSHFSIKDPYMYNCYDVTDAK